MKAMFINKTFNAINNQRNLLEIEKKRIRYGLEALYNLVSKQIVLIILALIFNLFKEFIILTAVCFTFRLFAFGLHANTSKACWFITLPVYILGSFYIKYIVTPDILVYIVFLAGFISFLLFAPADTPKRPLIHKDKRRKQKVLSLAILSLYFIIINFYPNVVLINSVFLGIIIQSTIINPLTYRIFKTPYNNYKTFNKVNSTVKEYN